MSRLASAAALLLGLLTTGTGWGTEAGPITTGALQIQGNRLTLYADELTTDADQTVSVGERARVRTCYGPSGSACGAAFPGDPRIAGLLVRGELRGPEVPTPIVLETVPGGTFILPGFQQEGDYRLENIRLVEEGSGQVLATAEPSLAILHVREILLASASVRTLSLEELRARGITFTAENFQAFNFAVGFAFGDEIVEIELPIVYSGYGTVQALDKPRVNLDGLPANVAHEVKRWQPPNIVPFKLEVPEEERLCSGGKKCQEEDEELNLPLFGAIVIPGTVSYLNQFFEAKLIVANGAPVGSGVFLEQITGSLRLPPNNVVRIVQSEPSVAPGQAVPVVDSTGRRSLAPGEQGGAAWTVEGLAAGTYTLQMDINATLARAGRDPFPLLSRIQAAIEVVDARFNLSFSHPDVVREGEEYSLFVTVTNLSRATQNLITVDLDEAHITGAHRADPGDNLKRTIQTLAPGQAETLEYRLVADLDGKVVATTFQSTSSAGQGTIRLRTGVGELGIPLSPATLVLPRFSERLKKPYLPSDDFYRAHLRFLGLAYSLAVAPAALTPSGLPRVIKTDVEQRAVDFAFAGMRTYLHEPLLESLEVLALDYLGNRDGLAEIDELRRGTGKGLAVGTELGKLFRAQQAERTLSAEGFFDQLAETTTYTDPYLAALLLPATGSESLDLVVQGSFEGVFGSLTGEAGATGAQRTLPFGEVYPVLRSASQTATVPLALVGHIALDQELLVTVRNPTGQAATGTLLILVPEADGREDRRLEFENLTIPAGGAVTVRVGAPVDDPRPVDATNPANTAPAGSAPSERTVQRPPFRLIGAVQDFRLKEEGPDELGNMHRPNRYGNGVLYLFNRPPDKALAEDPESYRIRSTFSGQDTSGKPASGVSDKVGTGAWVQEDPRIVAVRYSTPLSALVAPGSGAALLTHQHLLDTVGLKDAWGESLDANLPPPTIETFPLHFGGLVTGKVVRGTGEPVAGAKVQLIRPLLWETMADTIVKLDYLGEVTTGADGVFYFDFIEIPSWDKQVVPSFTLRATIPAGADPALQPEEVQEISSTVRLQNRALRINIALLGRGTVKGKVVYADDGSAVGTGFVRASSTLFNEEKSVTAKADGSFLIAGVPVGPITLTARDRDNRVVYATVGVAQPGDVVEVLLRMPRIIPGLGSVAGTVVGATDGEPIAGARVAVYSKGASLDSQETDAFGRFRFDNVPEGQVSLQAANWAVSRVSIFTDLLLAAGETQEVELRLPQGASRTVTGSVFFHDPITNTNVPIQGAVAFISGPGVFAYTDAAGQYRIEGVPVQGAGESYAVKAIDFTRKLEGTVSLPPILDVTPDPVAAQSIVLQQMSGGIDGVVLDPLGRPVGGAEVVVFPYGTTTSGPDGSFSFSNLPLGGHSVVAHVGDGLQAGKAGYFGDASASIVYGGHRPFVSVRMRGAGVVTVLTRTATATGVLTPIYYKPTYYSSTEYRIRMKGAYIETSTNPNGELEVALPVGDYELIAYNPFHGMITINGKIEYAGQVVHHEIVFEDAATVTGQVVGVDGVTPVPGVEVVMEANGLKGQTQRTDPQGRFRYELVPMGRVMVTATGLAGSIERVGRTIGYVGTAGQTLDLVVQMKAQGTVSGRVMENFNSVVRPLANAYYYLQEDTFPYRRIPEEGAWRVTDAQGNYSVPHVYAGGVTVVARDSGQVGRYGSVRGTLAFDWQNLQMPDVVMVTSVGSLRLTVRNPVSGGPVADAQVRLSNNDATVTDSEGIAFFDALPLGTYSIYAFYAPTGQSGRLSNVQLTSPGQQIARTVYLDQRGDVRGTLWNDAAKTDPVEGGIVRLDGETAGGRVTALATTSSDAATAGRFEFQGIPEGTFLLEAAHPTTPQRASATAAITATSPVVDINMILEAIGDRYFRLFEKLKAGNAAVNLTSGVFSTRLVQYPVYDFAQLAPVAGTDRFRFPSVLISRGGGFSAEELTGERRRTGASFNDFTSAPPVAGTGTQGDPYQLVLSPKGVVRVSVRNAAGQPAAGANVTLNTSGGGFPSITGADGTVTFAAVPSGALNATASSLATGTSGYSTATLTFDDDLIEMTVALAPAVSAHGVVYLPVPNDIWNGDPALLAPAPGIIVEIRDAKNRTQLVLTDALGTYRFAGLPTGGYGITARNNNGDQLAAVAGTLAGPDGNDNAIPSLILDAGPPRLLTIAPPPGFEGVSRTAAVELVFSEPLLAGVLPNNAGNPAGYFSLRSATGNWAQGLWSSSIDAAGQQVVRFVPSVPYENLTTYSLNVAGGPGGVRDRMGRPLTSSGNVGSNFKTSDSVGPAVIATNPDLSRPVDPTVPVRFDFSEGVRATDEQLDGDLSGDAAELYWQRDTDGPGGAAPAWVRLPVTTFLTRSNYSLVVQPVEGVSLDGDTLQRRIVLAGLKDSYDNVMPVYERTFRIYDERAPRVDAVPYPPSAPTGQLLQSERYAISPLLSALDDVTAQKPGGDVERVDYFFEDPTDPTHPVSPAYSARIFPYAFSFVAAYVGDGTAPRPFPVWVQAVDTSTNKSNVMLASMVVLPNTDPSIETIGVSATSPVPGVPYAGSTLIATVDGLYDLDGSQLTLFAELWKQGAGAPLFTAPARFVQRPATGWNDAPSQTFTFTLPIDIEEGTGLYARARVLDSNGSVGLKESDRLAVTDDAAPAEVDDFSARLAGAPVTHLFIGEEFYLEIKARDRETAIQSMVLELDRTDLFPGPISAAKVTGTTDLYRTGMLTVPPGMSSPIPITAKLRIDDWGGNSVERTTVFNVGPERDPNAPQARWQSPWQGALWPADYTSTVSSSAGAAILLRFYARDTNVDADGNPVPGKLVTVQFRGPVRNPGTGELEMAGTWTSAVKVAGTEDLAGAVYQGLWRVPNGIPVGSDVAFEARLLDSAGTETIAPVTMTAVAARQVYEAALTAVSATDPMLAPAGNPDGPVFLLDGTTLSILPQPAGAEGRPVRRVGGLFLYTGGSTDTGTLVVKPTVLTGPEITTYDSAILYHPFELAVDNEVGVAVESRIDMTKKGLLGSTSTKRMELPGEPVSQSKAGGSHGGRGWFGSPGGWSRNDLTQSGTQYDNLREPYLPGGGGGSADASAGGAGGGVIRLLAEGARVRLDGDVVANGGNGTGGNSGGGAGGAIRLTARRLEGTGRIQALGGGGTFFNTTGGGGGGRISLSYQELSTSFDLANKVDASGGINDAPVPTRADRRGGAGTVFVEVVDPATGLPAPGKLFVENPLEPVRTALTPLPALGDGNVFSIDSANAKVVLDVASVRGDLAGDDVALAAADGTALGSFPILRQQRVADGSAPGGFRIHLTVAATPAELDPAAVALGSGAVNFHGVSRLLAVEAEASVRLTADDDLVLGPDDAPVLNDRSKILLKRGARAMLRGEGPVVTFTTAPAAGTDLLLGSSATVAWTVSDPLGLAETKTESTFAPTPAVTPLWDEPVTAQSTSTTTLSVPIVSALTGVSYTVEARNNAGRVTRTTASWPVLPNALPAGQVTLATGTATPVKAGYPFTAVVAATDRERLLKVTLTVTGPATPTPQTATITGTSASPTFTLNVPATADGSQPIVLQALVEDASGGSTTTAAFSVPIAANGAPTGTVAIATGSPAQIEPGKSTTIAVHAEDADGLAKIDLHVAGSPPAITQPDQTKTLTGNPTAADATFTITGAANATPQTLSVTATIQDRFGSSSTTAVLTVPLVANGVPSGAVALATGAPSPIEPGMTTTVVVTATDPDGLTKIDLHAVGEVTQPEQTKTVTGTTVSTTFTLTAAANATTPQTVSVTATLRDTVGSTADTAPFTFQIVADVDKPVATITLNPDRGASGVYRPGEVVNVTASATDDVAVAALELTVDGVTNTSTGAPITYAWTIPAVTGPTPFTLTAKATDGEGNQGTASRVVNTAPVPADPPPTVSFTCPATGALLPTDYVAALSAAASDNAGVTAVRFYLGDATTPFSTFTPAGTPPLTTTASANFDLATTTESTVRFRVEATDTAGQVSSQVIEVQRVTVVNLKADGAGTNNYASLTNEIVALRTGTLTIDTPVTFGGLLVLNGAKIVHTATPSNTSPKSFQVTVNGPVYVGCGGSIDVTGRGYPLRVTYPTHVVEGSYSGGSHMGEGGVENLPPGETYGSVYFPQENGAGGYWEGNGGGVVRIVADRAQVDGVIRANGSSACRGSAGGSVWLKTAALAGVGSIEAKGGATTCNERSGGGGAIAVDYGQLDAGSTLLDHLGAQGGGLGNTGGAGTVYMRAGGQGNGQLIIDNGTVPGNKRTILPSLGKGTAGAGSGGATLATGRSKTIPAYFVGHWVEVRSAATGALEGTWRVASIAADGFTVTLASNTGEAVTVDPNDAWQGIYRVDSFTIRGSVQLDSADPIRVAGDEIIAGAVETTAIEAGRLVVKAGATLTQHPTPSNSSPQSLQINVGELVVESGGVIDVTGRGYPLRVTYPNHVVEGSYSGGSHLG
ncbi:MAG: carboxypeptidase regulatory-like domain-containing protein, partial [Thermoanaerobaculia bacterium]